MTVIAYKDGILAVDTYSTGSFNEKSYKNIKCYHNPAREVTVAIAGLLPTPNYAWEIAHRIQAIEPDDASTFGNRDTYETVYETLYPYLKSISDQNDTGTTQVFIKLGYDT